VLIVMQDVDPWPLNPVDAPALLERRRNATARPRTIWRSPLDVLGKSRASSEPTHIPIFCSVG
jgi:hypothetical protein